MFPFVTDREHIRIRGLIRLPILTGHVPFFLWSLKSATSSPSSGICVWNKYTQKRFLSISFSHLKIGTNWIWSHFLSLLLVKQNFFCSLIVRWEMWFGSDFRWDFINSCPWLIPFSSITRPVWTIFYLIQTSSSYFTLNHVRHCVPEEKCQPFWDILQTW